LDYHPLHLACIHGHVGVVKILIDAGADEDETDAFVCTPFSRAVEFGQRYVVRFLLDDRGQDVDGRMKNGRFAPHCSLFVAASEGRESMIRLLVEEGADVDLRLPIGTPLHGAVYGASLPATRLLVELGADPTIRDDRHGSLTPEQLERFLFERSEHLQGLLDREKQQGWAEIAAFYAALPHEAAEEGEEGEEGEERNGNDNEDEDEDEAGDIFG
jgi:ankyrin repeat protein